MDEEIKPHESDEAKAMYHFGLLLPKIAIENGYTGFGHSFE